MSFGFGFALPRSFLRAGISSALSLNFLTGTLDPRITFSRASNATVTGSNGLIQYAPNNLLTYSEDFSNAAWSKTNSFIQTNLLTYSEDFSNAAWNKNNSTYSGTVLTATGTSEASINQLLTAPVNATYTVTVRASKGSAGALLYVRNIFANDGLPSGVATFDLETGTVAYTGSAYLSVTINAVGAGVYDCITVITKTGATAANRLDIGITTSSTGGVSCTVGNSINVYRTQLVQGATPGEYQPTAGTTAAVQYTNPFGGRTADKLVENTTAGNHFIGPSAISTTAGLPYTWSVYVKAAERTKFSVFDNFGGNATVNFDLITGTQISGSTVGITITSVGDSWWRISRTLTSIGGNTIHFDTVDSSGATSYTGDGTSGIYVWGAQLELGSTATAYNPTTAAAYYGPRFDYDGSALTYTEQYGNNVASNGDFSNGSTGWSTSANWLISGGAATSNGTGGDLYQSGFVANRRYKLTFTVTAYTSGLMNIRGSSTGYRVWSVGTYEVIFADSSGQLVFQSSTFAGSITNISVREYIGLTASGTATPKGLLIEEQRTNLLTYSERFDNAAWQKINSTVSANTTIAPDGTVTADQVQGDGASSNHEARQTISSTSAVTLSTYLKQGTERYAYLYFLGRTATNDTTNAVFVDLQTGTITSSSGTDALTPTITSVGNGWYRVTAGRSTAFSGSTQIEIRIGVANAPNVQASTATGYVYVWGAQLEVGAFATSYIPTVAAQVTRAADNATMTGANFSSWFNPTEGTFVVGATTPTISGASNSSLIEARDSPANQSRISFYRSGAQAVVAYYDNGPLQAALSLGSFITANTLFKVAGAYKINDFAGSLLGNAVVTDTAGTVPSNINTLWIGSNVAVNSYYNAHIRSIDYYNTRLPNATLQGLTT
jgi:hypothetical protein